MPLRLNVGVSRKVGLPDYGSLGASCSLDLELDAGLLEHDLDGFHERVRGAYVAAQQAVNDELARLQAPIAVQREMPAPPPARVTNGRADGNGHAEHRPAERARGRKPATDNQVKAIRSIARRQNADLDGVLRQDFGVERPEDLSLKQASELIDLLKAAGQV